MLVHTLSDKDSVVIVRGVRIICNKEKLVFDAPPATRITIKRNDEANKYLMQIEKRRVLKRLASITKNI
jgi:hypothetical protein